MDRGQIQTNIQIPTFFVTNLKGPKSPALVRARGQRGMGMGPGAPGKPVIGHDGCVVWYSEISLSISMLHKLLSWGV